MSAGSPVAFATATDDAAPGVNRRRSTDQHSVDLLGRWSFLVVLLAVGFLETWVRVAREEASGAGSAVLLAPVVGAGLTAVTLRLRRRPQLPIYDRQSDKIVGTVVLAVALMVQWLVLPRYSGSYVLLHLDVLAAWVFLLGACSFVFGLRRTGSYWPAWLVLLLIPPGFVRLAVTAFGGDLSAQIPVALAVVLVGPLAVASPGLVRAVRRLPGSVGSRVAPSHAEGPGHEQRPRGEAGPQRVAAPVVSRREAWRSAPLLMVVALALALAPLPQGVSERLSPGPPDEGRPGQLVPAGWQQVDSVDHPWAERMFGRSATLYRQTIRATRTRADWDPLLRPRQAVVQSLTVGGAGILEVYPFETTFDLSEARVSPPRTVDLGRSVTARYRTVIDERELLTWSLMTFVWSRSTEKVQRVTLITVDNHEYDAEFPETVPGTRSTFRRQVNLLLRGTAAITDTDSQDKDLAMLTELGAALVEAQWTDE